MTNVLAFNEAAWRVLQKSQFVEENIRSGESPIGSDATGPGSRIVVTHSKVWHRFPTENRWPQHPLEPEQCLLPRLIPRNLTVKGGENGDNKFIE